MQIEMCTQLLSLVNLNKKMTTKFRKIKPELRILGIDDAPFEKFGEGTTLLVGSVFRAGEWLDGVLSRTIEVDGMDANDKLVEMINETRHKDQLRVAMLDGITFGGMNIVDIQDVYKRTNLPVIVVNRKIPDFEKIEKALDNFEDKTARWSCIESAGEVHELKNKNKKLFIQVAGISVEDAKEIVKISCTRGNIPEPIRVSHLIARGVTLGESRGRA